MASSQSGHKFGSYVKSVANRNRPELISIQGSSRKSIMFYPIWTPTGVGTDNFPFRSGSVLEWMGVSEIPLKVVSDRGEHKSFSPVKVVTYRE